MKFELDNFTPPSFTVVNSALLLLPTKFFRLAKVAHSALKCKRYKRFCANSFTAS